MCSGALITFKKSLFKISLLPPTLTRATEEVKQMHRDATLIGDKEISLAFWTLSSFVATLYGPIGEERVYEPSNQTLWDLV
jgi:hypothetical protein